MILAVW
jgi:hypothetical protein